MVNKFMWDKKNKQASEEVFIALTVSLVVFWIMELIKPRIVLAYFNPNYLLLAWLIFGIILLKIGDKNNKIEL